MLVDLVITSLPLYFVVKLNRRKGLQRILSSFTRIKLDCVIFLTLSNQAELFTNSCSYDTVDNAAMFNKSVIHVKKCL